jgi:hypothetical protein
MKDLADVYATGRRALKSLKKERSWLAWLAVGEAVAEGRREAMELVGTNRPIGAAYNKAFSEILRREKLGTEELPSATRNQLFDIIDHRGEIESWRSTLEPFERIKLNHPDTVLRHWKKTATARELLGLEEEKPKAEKKTSAKEEKASLLEELVLAQERITQLEARIEELEQELEFERAKSAQSA